LHWCKEENYVWLGKVPRASPVVTCTVVEVCARILPQNSTLTHSSPPLMQTCHDHIGSRSNQNFIPQILHRCEVSSLWTAETLKIIIQLRTTSNKSAMWMGGLSTTGSRSLRTRS